VPRGFLKTDTEFFTGKRPGKQARHQAIRKLRLDLSLAGPARTTPRMSLARLLILMMLRFPLPVTKEIVDRGKERYEIFCSACHGLTGNGDGMIVRRGFRRAASFNDDRLRQAPVGHFFDAITNGWGVMPAYAPQIPAQDRWAIIAYIRALQLSQQSQQSQTQPAAASTGATPATQSGGQH